MSSPSESVIAPGKRLLAACLFLIALACVVLFGWAFNLPALKSVFPNAPTMKINTAIGMLLCGVALALVSWGRSSRSRRGWAVACGGLVATLGALSLIEYLFGWDLRIDQLLFHDVTGAQPMDYPGRMSPATAMCFVISGAALVIASVPNGRRWRWPLLNALSGAVSAMGALVVLSALLTVLLCVHFSIYPGVAVHTAVGFLVLGLALLALVRAEGGAVWSVDSATTTGIVVSVACLLFVAAFSNIFISQIQQDDIWVSHTQEVLKEILLVGGDMAELENSLREYVVTGDERALAQRSRTNQLLLEHVDRVRSLTLDNPNQQRRLTELMRLNELRNRSMLEVAALRHTTGIAEVEVSPAAVALRALSDQMRELRKQMRDEENILLDRRAASSRNTATRTFLLLPLGLFLSLTMFSIAVFFLNASAGERARVEHALRAANEHLRATDERFRLLISGVKDCAIYLLDAEGHVATWNAGAHLLKQWTEEEIVGQHFSIFYPREDQAEDKPRRILEIAKAQGHYEDQGWRVRKDGSRFWADVLISSIRDDQGQLTGFAKVTRDRSERRRFEQAIRDDEARLAAVIDSAMDAVITMDAYQRITLFNPAAERMFGYRAEEAMGRDLDHLMPERFRSSHARHIRAFAQTNISRRKMGALTAIYGLRSNGEEFPIDASISQVEVAGQKIFSVILRDISERARADEELRQQASLLDLAPVLVRDMQNRIVFWSSGLEQLYGYSRAQAQGQTSHELLRTQFPIPVADIEQHLASHGSWEGELLHRASDGSQVVVTSQWVLYRNSLGEPTRILEVNTDITARKRIESLQARSQKLESLGTLSGGIAHDFNNILLAITGNAKLAIADLPSTHPVQQSLSEIAKAGARATDLVRRILSFSRPGEMKRHVIELQPVVEEALKLVRATLPATIEFRTHFALGVPPVLADATQVHQIIVNLATNAAHAIGSRSDGVVEIHLDSAVLTEDDVSPSLNLREGSYVRLFVSDNGCGMDREILDRIFDPFFTTKAPGEGTGLGLSVVHGIMKNHHGGVAVYSEPRRGTAFRLFFPVAAAPIETGAPEPIAEIHRRRTENVLYVDDEEALVALVTRTLGRLGYTVTGRTNPIEALELFRANPAAFDAVVTDLAMPQLSGFDLATRMLAIRPELPIIMTSGFVRPEDQERALAMGLRDLILKPDTIAQLGRTLDRLFQEHASLRPNSTNS